MSPRGWWLLAGIAASGCREQKAPAPPIARAGPSDGGKPAAPPLSESRAPVGDIPRQQLEVRQGSPYRKAQARIEPLRTTAVFESALTETGLVVGTKRGTPAQLAIVATPSR